MKTKILLALVACTAVIAAGAKSIRVSVCNNNYNSFTTIRFAEGATTGFDRRTDKMVKRLPANKVNYVFTTDGTRFMYENACPVAQSYTAIPLCILVGDTGKCEIGIEDLDNDLRGMSFSLTDVMSGEMIALTPGSSVAFGPHDLGAQRNYILNVFPTPKIEATPVSCYNSSNGTVSFGFKTTGEWSAQLRNTKELVANMTSASASAYFENLAAGIYFAQIRMNNMLVWEEIIPVRRPPVVQSDFTVVSDTLQAGEQLVVSTKVNGNSHFYWEFGDNTSAQVFSPVHSYSSPGTYVVSLTTADVAGCISVGKKTVTVTGPVVSTQGNGHRLFSE